MRLKREFFTCSAYDLGINLLGKTICIENNNEIKKYRIVETESYGGITDKAAHSYNNTRTNRTEVMYNEGGYVYIYLIYGMYYMLNIVASTKDNPEAVLIRAVEPLFEDESTKLQTNGPGKLCKYMGIDKTFNGLDLCISDKIYIIDECYQIGEIVYRKRINIDYAEEDKDRLWRFYLKNNRFVSKK